MNATHIVTAVMISQVFVALGGDPPKRGRARAFYRNGDNAQAVSLDDAKGCWFDHRDGVGGGMLDLIERVLGCDRADALRWLSSFAGTPLADRSFTDRPPSRRERRVLAQRRQQEQRDLRDHPDRDDSNRTNAALSIWKSTNAGFGTPVETYLRSRLVTIPLPPNLRFHAGLKHPSGNVWPVMVALVTRGTDDIPLAIHRTFLAHGGNGKAPVEPQKMMLGPCRGGAVRLAPPSDVLMVGEGIETCLAAMQEAKCPAWAALSTSGLRSLDLPPEVREIIVLADGDDSGEAAAQDCGLRWKREGRHVRIARAPRGLDFNDMLLGSEPRLEGSTA
jgi:hypothetical protein